MRKLSLLLAIALPVLINSCSSTIGNEEHKVENTINSDDKVEKQDEIKPEHLTLESFKEKVWNFEENPQEWVFKGETPAVIDFYAVWCRPCKMVAPIMDEMAKKYDGKVKIYKIDTDKEKELAGIFQIRSIPAVLFIPTKGQPIMQTGAMPRDSYIEIIEKELINKK